MQTTLHSTLAWWIVAERARKVSDMPAPAVPAAEVL